MAPVLRSPRVLPADLMARAKLSNTWSLASPTVKTPDMMSTLLVLPVIALTCV